MVRRPLLSVSSWRNRFMICRSSVSDSFPDASRQPVANSNLSTFLSPSWSIPSACSRVNASALNEPPPEPSAEESPWTSSSSATTFPKPVAKQAQPTFIYSTENMRITRFEMSNPDAPNPTVELVTTAQCRLPTTGHLCTMPYVSAPTKVGTTINRMPSANSILRFNESTRSPSGLSSAARVSWSCRRSKSLIRSPTASVITPSTRVPATPTPAIR
mmetsp:Transcript_26689/g.67241  ORF Transcript_26689/g.67241 Transcript_26689/m.67241 type:complete len:216 (-) Transcript_26689:1060-1707(-)